MSSSKEIKEFSRNIETFASNTNLTLIDAIVEYCTRNNLDVVSAAKMITPKLKKRIMSQAMSRNQLKIKKEKGLPV